MWLATSDPPGPVPSRPYPLFRHELETGTLVVAERSDGEVIGFGASMARPGRWLLGDLFIDPGTQGLGVGRGLLETLVDLDRPGPARITLASGDPRAVGLYTRFGMTPRCPVFYLTARSADRFPPARPDPAADPETTAVAVVDLDRFRVAAQALGHAVDPADLAYLDATLDVTGVVVGPPAAPVAAAVVRWGHPFVLSDPHAVTVAPLVLAEGTPAAPVAAALLGWIEAQGRRPDGSGIRLFVPGPHPLLPLLLDAGFAIVDMDTLCAADEALSGPAAFSPTTTCPAADIP